MYFVGPGGYGLSAAASPEVFLAAVEAAGFGQDGHLQSSADTFFMTGEPDDPHDARAAAVGGARGVRDRVEHRRRAGRRVPLRHRGARLPRRGAGAVPSGDAGGDAEADEAGEVVGDGESDGDDEPRRPDGGDAAALCAAFGGDPDAVEGLLRGVTPVEDPVFHAESLHAALAAALGLPAATVGFGFGHLAEGIELGAADQARLVRVG